MLNKNHRRLMNELAFEKLSLRERKRKRDEEDEVVAKAMTRADVRKLRLEQKEHQMYLLGCWVGAPFRRDLRYICKKLNMTTQAARYLMDHPKWASISERVMKDIRKKHLVQVQGKAVELALLGSTKHMQMILDQENIITRKSEVHHVNKEIPDDPKAIDDEIAQLTSEVGEMQEEA